MTDVRHPYADKNAVLATMHRKEEVIVPPFWSIHGLAISTVPGLDTDQLGTFSGEIPRNGTMLDVAVRKARLGMRAAAAPLGLASEGTFGPHPAVPFFPAGMELMVFVDDERGIVVSESLIAEKTNFDYLVVAVGEEPTAFLRRIGFPSHALMVRPNQGDGATGFAKGVATPTHLTNAIASAAALSADGRARLETDMRAHLNPTRMQSLALLAERLARRLAQQCPICDTPGFGRTGTRTGLRCADCDTPTGMVAAEVFSCPACDHREEQARADGMQMAPAQCCPACNP